MDCIKLLLTQIYHYQLVLHLDKMQSSLWSATFVTLLVFVTVICYDRKQEKANLIKKHIKRLKKQEGALKLVGGRGEFEGVYFQYCQIHS